MSWPGASAGVMFAQFDAWMEAFGRPFEVKVVAEKL
jgi:hypothetical protein